MYKYYKELLSVQEKICAKKASFSFFFEKRKHFLSKQKKNEKCAKSITDYLISRLTPVGSKRTFIHNCKSMQKSVNMFMVMHIVRLCRAKRRRKKR